jgi:hypothetical protein
MSEKKENEKEKNGRREEEEEEETPDTFSDTKSREDQWRLAGKKVDEKAAEK